MAVMRFEDLSIWQSARSYNKKIVLATRDCAFARDGHIITQLRRASLSIMNNIAEGFERWKRPEFLHFLSIAKGSAGETRSTLYCALDSGCLSQSDFESLAADASHLASMIGAFRTKLAQSPPKTVAKTPRPRKP